MSEYMKYITDLEKDVLMHGFGDNEYNSTNDETGVVWSWSIAGNCKIATKHQVPGVISSLVKKGIMHSYSRDNHDDEVVALTDKGKGIFRLLKAYRYR